jgi:histidinol-phosphate aminotransferase
MHTKAQERSFFGNLLPKSTTMSAVNRRDWLKQGSLAALALGFRLPSMANEEGITRNFGAAAGLINLGSNENPYGISPLAKQAVIDAMGEGNRYQFNIPVYRDIAKDIAGYYQLNAGNLLVTAGSGDALGLLARHFTKGNIVSAYPTFATLPRTAKRLGTKVTDVPLTADKKHDLPAMLKAMDSDTKLVYVCNPANPSSTIIAPDTLRSFCEEASKKATVVIDEAYIDFLNPPDNISMVGLIDKNPNIIIVRTFSKIHAMAGMRIGFIAAHPSTIDALANSYFSSTQMTVSNLTMAAAIASLKDEKHSSSCKAKNAAARDYTFQSLTTLGYKAIPSYTNFIFFPLGNYPGEFAQDMLKKNIVLRSDTYPDGKWGRVSIGTMEEMQQFISIMKAIS